MIIDIFGIYLCSLNLEQILEILDFFQTPASGVFELRLLSFDNQAGKDDTGKCCSGRPSGLECEGDCRPRFRVCLKEYQVKIDATSPCTFGDVITSELGPGPADDPQSGFANAIAVKFPFTWPVGIFFIRNFAITCFL